MNSALDVVCPLLPPTVSKPPAPVPVAETEEAVFNEVPLGYWGEVADMDTPPGRGCEALEFHLLHS